MIVFCVVMHLETVMYSNYSTEDGCGGCDCREGCGYRNGGNIETVM